MGVLAELIVADPVEAADVAESDEPTRSWDGFSCKGLDNIKLITLWALVESGLADDRVEQRLDALRAHSESENGPWVHVVPEKMLQALASVAVMDDDELGTLATTWGQTEEFDGWDPSEVSDLLRSVGDLAESAQLEGKTLLLWMCL